MRYLQAVPILLLLREAPAFSPPSLITGSRDGSLALMMKVPFLGRFRGKRSTGGKVEPISIGSPIPDVDVELLTGDDEAIAVPVSVRDVVGQGTAVLVGMPGAFTTTCHTKHLPGYIKAAPKLKELGVDQIAVVTTNDRFVNDQWSKECDIGSSAGGVAILCDADGDLVNALGLAEDMGFGMGIRSKRFAILLEDGKVQKVFTDDGMDDCSSTSADALVASLSPDVVSSDRAFDPALLAVGVGGVLLLALTFLNAGKVVDGGSGASDVFALLNTYK
jgi:glutaredoxin/glutathione-dependent peroxiredoxin